MLQQEHVYNKNLKYIRPISEVKQSALKKEQENIIACLKK